MGGVSPPLVRRRTARLLVVDQDDRLLLFADSDPAVPGSRMWITPGGAIEPGESERDAAVRKLREETGHLATPADLDGPVPRRRVTHGFSNKVVHQHDVFYGLRAPRSPSTSPATPTRSA